MNKFFFLLLSFFYKYIENITIYQCSRYSGMQEQCLNKWIDSYGNTRMDLWRCPTNKYCQILSRKEQNNSIGVCTYDYKKKYDQDHCSYDSECTSFFCSEGKCVGLSENALCRPGIFQCQNNLVCKKSIEIYPYNEKKELYKCGKLSKINETCENDNECDIRLVCINQNLVDIINNSTSNNISDLKYEIFVDEYNLIKNENNKICIERASLENGLPANDAMACISGDIINIEIFPNYNETLCVSKKEIIRDCNEKNLCLIKANLGKFGDIEIEQECIFSVLGNRLCPLEQREVAWKNYLSTFNKYYSISKQSKKFDTNFHIPAHKYTFNILEISQAYWKYSEWTYFIEADICAQEYFFLTNKGKIINFSILYILFHFIILYI